MEESKIIKELQGILSENQIKTEPSLLEEYGKDWTKIYAPNPLAVAFPKSTDEVAKILAFCHQNKVPVVPSGGRTGLAGACVAANKELVISLEKMNKIGTVDLVGMTIEVEAGAITQNVQEAAKSKGVMFSLDLAAKGSCQIGGNIATNAGGLKLIRYGGAREQVLGLEVVLSDGKVLQMNTRLKKNNTGYDLKQLFIGSEGTLGIITKATLKLTQLPGNIQLACLGVESFFHIPSILEKCNTLATQITAFEFYSSIALKRVLKMFPNAGAPFETDASYYVLLEIEESKSLAMETLLEKIFEDGLVVDGVLASNSEEFQKLWDLRENITESLAASSHVRKNDVSLPIDLLSNFISDIDSLAQNLDTSIELVLFGHVGDGNVHVNYTADKEMNFDEFNQRALKIEHKVFDAVTKYAGSISAEHGIGLLKRDDLIHSRSKDEIALMKSIKELLDPKGIMNPGKIFPS